MTSRIIHITNPIGLHLLPATKLAGICERCSSKVQLVAGTRTVNAKSVLGVVSLGLVKGSSAELRCFGPDEEKDIETISEFIEDLND